MSDKLWQKSFNCIYTVKTCSKLKLIFVDYLFILTSGSCWFPQSFRQLLWVNKYSCSFLFVDDVTILNKFCLMFGWITIFHLRLCIGFCKIYMFCIKFYLYFTYPKLCKSFLFPHKSFFLQMLCKTFCTWTIGLLYYVNSSCFSAHLDIKWNYLNNYILLF